VIKYQVHYSTVASLCQAIAGGCGRTTYTPSPRVLTSGKVPHDRATRRRVGVVPKVRGKQVVDSRWRVDCCCALAEAGFVIPPWPAGLQIRRQQGEGGVSPLFTRLGWHPYDCGAVVGSAMLPCWAGAQCLWGRPVGATHRVAPTFSTPSAGGWVVFTNRCLRLTLGWNSNQGWVITPCRRVGKGSGHQNSVTVSDDNCWSLGSAKSRVV
jgi:hypothetical protein